MQRLRPISIRLAAKPLRTGVETGEGRPASRYGAKLPATTPDRTERALRVLTDIMMYGSEPARLTAARTILQKAWGKPKREAVEDEPPCPVPVIQYIIRGDPPELGPDDYDTRDQPEPPFGGLMTGWGKTEE